MRKLLLMLFALGTAYISQGQVVPIGGGQWGCPSIPIRGTFDTTCFQRTGEIRLGQGYFDHYGSSDPIYAIIPQNRPSFAIAFAIGWDFYRNTVGNNAMSINQWFATTCQENGFATYNGVVLPATTYDLSVGANVVVPCTYPRGCNSNTCAGAGYCWHVSQNGTDGPFHNTLAGYQTTSPYVPGRYPGPATTYHPLYNSTFESAVMNKTFYDLSIYRRAQFMNNIDLGQIENAGTNDPYGVEAAQAVAYNLGPNAAQCIGAPGYALPAGIATNNNWSVNYFNGGVSCYAQRVANITAVLDNNQAYATSHYPGACGGTVGSWNFYDFYDAQIKWDTVAASIDRLLITMYPEYNAAARTAFKAKVQAVFNRMDADANGFISYRYEMGAVIDEIVMNLPKDDPGFNAQYAINGTGCKLGCRSPYVTIKPTGPTTICPNQQVILWADVDSYTPSTTYQWYRNGVAIAAGSGGTNDTLIASTAGTYEVVTCWQSYSEVSPYNLVTCCSRSQCSVTITVQASCSSCGMAFPAAFTANSCTGMANGTITVNVGATGPGGNLIYSWSGPSSGSVTTSATSYTITGLRDGKYTVTVTSQTTPSCKFVRDITIIPTTYIKESLTASANNTACPVQLQATLVSPQPTACPVRVSYGALNVASWDRSFFMDLRVNGSTVLTMFEGQISSWPNDDPWDWWPYAWPQGGPGGGGVGAPNWKTIYLFDGDTISVYGTTLVPQGTPVPAFIDGGVLVENANFRQVGTTVTTTSQGFRYRGTPLAAPSPVIAPTNGTRQMQNSYVVSCPVVSPPAYTYSWTPTSGLNNPNIANPTASIGSGTVYTVTATHPGNPACQLTATATATRVCSPLPVDLIYFDAQLQNGVVVLDWTTANERDCKTYHIERSRDGISFERVGAVTCLNISALHEYSSVDNNPLSGVSWYRIAAEDVDGTIAYTETRVVNVNTATAFIYPNPFSNEVNISLGGTPVEQVTVIVRDINGRTLQTYRVAGNAQLVIGADLPAAVYIVEVSNNYGVKNYKVVKQ